MGFNSAFKGLRKKAVQFCIHFAPRKSAMFFLFVSVPHQDLGKYLAAHGDADDNRRHPFLNTFKPKPEWCSISSNLLCIPRFSSARAYVFMYTLQCRQLEFGFGSHGSSHWTVLYLVLPSEDFRLGGGADQFTISCLQSRCGLHFVL